MLKAAKEPGSYELDQERTVRRALRKFVERTLTVPSAARFLIRSARSQTSGARGMINSLAQVLLKIASPAFRTSIEGPSSGI